jgi:hypothetical protein
MIQWPRKLGGKPKIVSWLNRMLDGVRASEVKGVIGGRLIENSDGKVIVFGDSQSTATPLQMFVLIEEFNDYLRCAPLEIAQDGTRTFTSGDGDSYIAKPPELRHAIADETIDGDAINYTYLDTHTREASLALSPEITETQNVVPWYLPEDDANEGSTIYAAEVLGGTGVYREVTTGNWQQLKLVEVSSRAWARRSKPYAALVGEGAGEAISGEGGEAITGEK